MNVFHNNSYSEATHDCKQNVYLTSRKTYIAML